jgi:hypothetical protein
MIAPFGVVTLGGRMAERPTEVVEGDARRVGEADERRPERAQKVRAYLKRHPWIQRVLGLILLSPVCVLAVVFWGVPVSEPLTVSALLADRALLLCTALVLPVCVLVLAAGSWRWARLGAVAGAVVAVALGGSTSLAALRPPVDPWPTVLAAAALAGGIGLLSWTQTRCCGPGAVRSLLLVCLRCCRLSNFGTLRRSCRLT